MLSVCVALFLGCNRESHWPPPPQNQQEARLIEAAARAISQIDGWAEVVYVVERRQAQWRVQAWRIVYPEARGRNRCVPWAVRAITLDDSATVLSYENAL